MADLSAAIDTDGVSEAHASFNAAETANQQDLTDGAGDTFTFTGAATTGVADTTATTVAGWDTAPANDITLEAAAGHESVKTSYDTNIYRLEGSDVNIVTVVEQYFNFNKIQVGVTITANNTGKGILIAFIFATGVVNINNCRIEAVSAAGTGGGYGIEVDDGDVTLNMHNTTVCGFISGADVQWRGIYLNNSSAANIYNCIFYGNYVGIYQSGGTTTVKNTASGNNNDDFFGTITIDYCLSDDGDGTNSQTPAGGDWSTIFTTPGTDYTALGTGNHKDNGVGPASDALVLTTDIDGDARAGNNCDIGIDEFLAVGGVPAAVIYHHFQTMRQ